jgi:hypothetical protein
MLRLNKPACTYKSVVDSCKLGITGNASLLEKLGESEEHLQTKANEYIALATLEELYKVSPIPSSNKSDPIVIGSLHKSELLKLYDQYFVKQNKPGRKIYDALIAAAQERCAFCGGIGRPRNLDHYLPKAHFPQFSILPVNLVPSCRDCNMEGKGEQFAANEEERVLQPYLDNDRYFNEQWISARLTIGNGGEPGVLEYFVQPPEHWSRTQKKRVEKHFNDFELGLRFSKEAGSRLIIFLDQIKALVRIPIELEVAKSTILQPAIDRAPFVNHWERVMCLTLMSELV